MCVTRRTTPTLGRTTRTRACRTSAISGEDRKIPFRQFKKRKPNDYCSRQCQDQGRQLGGSMACIKTQNAPVVSSSLNGGRAWPCCKRTLQSRSQALWCALSPPLPQSLRAWCYTTRNNWRCLANVRPNQYGEDSPGRLGRASHVKRYAAQATHPKYRAKLRT